MAAAMTVQHPKEAGKEGDKEGGHHHKEEDKEEDPLHKEENLLFLGSMGAAMPLGHRQREGRPHTAEKQQVLLLVEGVGRPTEDSHKEDRQREGRPREDLYREGRHKEE